MGDEVNLLPCPFCGCTEINAVREDAEDGKTFHVYCMCDGCHARGPRVYVPAFALTPLGLAQVPSEWSQSAWNQRAPTLLGLPIVEVDDLGDANQIVFGPPLI